MKHSLILSGLLVAAFMVGPTSVMADDHHGEKRYYDRHHRDYHYWNDGEDHQYREYLLERHEAYVPFERVNRRHREEYFRYRHAHGFKIEVH